MDYISDGIVVTGESVAMQVVVQTAGFGIFLLQPVNATWCFPAIIQLSQIS